MYHQHKIEEIRREIHTERICENGSVLPPVIAVRFEDYLINDNTLEVSYADEAESVDNLATDRNASENPVSQQARVRGILRRRIRMFPGGCRL